MRIVRGKNKGVINWEGISCFLLHTGHRGSLENYKILSQDSQLSWQDLNPILLDRRTSTRHCTLVQ